MRLRKRKKKTHPVLSMCLFSLARMLLMQDCRRSEEWELVTHLFALFCPTAAVMFITVPGCYGSTEVIPSSAAGCCWPFFHERRSPKVLKNDRMIYFTLRLFKCQTNWSWRKPSETPHTPLSPSLYLFSLAKCYTGQSIAQCLCLCQQRKWC